MTNLNDYTNQILQKVAIDTDKKVKSNFEMAKKYDAFASTPVQKKQKRDRSGPGLGDAVYNNLTSAPGKAWSSFKTDLSRAKSNLAKDIDARSKGRYGGMGDFWMPAMGAMALGGLGVANVGKNWIGGMIPGKIKAKFAGKAGKAGAKTAKKGLFKSLRRIF